MTYERRQRSTLAAVELLRTDEVCRRYGFKARTVLAWVEAGKLPAIKTPGGQWRYPARELDDAIRARREQLEREDQKRGTP
jgi:excisionase family DNA binding protein